MVKVNIISGFLGAGKTTLIKKLLSAIKPGTEKIILLENEYGDVGVDGAFMKDSGIIVDELNEVSKKYGEPRRTTILYAHEVTQTATLAAGYGVYGVLHILDSISVACQDRLIEQQRILRDVALRDVGVGKEGVVKNLHEVFVGDSLGS